MEEIGKKEWYQDMSLEDAKSIIKANITSMARSFIAVGYYLKQIRDREMYVEDGYCSLWEFAQGEYGISKSTASRYMTMNDRFSKEGNSPVISEEYKGFGKSQLQEMLYLSNEQIGQVTPETQVMDIRAIRRESPALTPYTGPQLTGQLDITAFLDMDTDVDDSDGLAGRDILLMPKFELSVSEMLDMGDDLSTDLADGTQEAEGRAVANRNGDLSQIPEEPAPYERGCITGKSRYGMCSCCGSDGVECCAACMEPCNGRCGWVNNPWTGAAKEQQTNLGEEKETVFRQNKDYSCSPEIESCAVEHFTLENKCFNDGAYGATWASIVSGYLDRRHDMGIVSMDDSIAEVEVSVMGHICTARQKDSAVEFWMGEKLWFMVDLDRLREEYEWFYPGHKQEEETTGWECTGCTHRWEEEEGFCLGCEVGSNYSASEQKLSESTIDAEFQEVNELSKEENTLEYFLDEQNGRLNELLYITRDKKLSTADVKTIERQKLIVCALAAMKVEEMKRTYKPEQPSLLRLKNNDQRAAFVDAYETWPLWIETVKTGERYYRYDLPDGTSMVVKAYQARIFDGYVEGSYESKYREGYGRQEYFLIEAGTYFKDCETSRSSLIEKLKEMQKKG